MPNFFSYVESQLVHQYGRDAVQGGGLRVYTTVDPRAQTIALDTMRDALGRPGDPASALVSIDPRSGAIRALVSSWHGHEQQFDLPADGARQTGSAFKPFVLTDPAQIWDGYMAQALRGTPVGTFHAGGWVLQPYRGPRTMEHPPNSGG